MTQAKLELPVLPKPEYRLSPDSEPSLYDPYDMQAYGLQCAAHARELALEEAAKEATDMRLFLCALAIEALKGK